MLIYKYSLYLTQNHIEPVPEFIVQNLLRGLGYTKKDFFDTLEQKKEVAKVGSKFVIRDIIKK